MISEQADFTHVDAYPAGFTAEYEPLKCLAHGENGETLIVRGKADDKLYVAKVLPKDAPDEGKILETLSHPALPRFAARFSGDEANIVVREYVDGLPLDEAIEKHGFSEIEAVRIGAALCDVLTYLHTRKPPVIHRDIKPQNVILCRNGTVKLIDFGISRRYKRNAGKDTVFSGTNEFAPPEQYGFAQTDERADIYSFGILMKYLLTGGNAECEIANRRIGRIIKHCTAFNPDERYKTAARVKRALLSDTPKSLKKKCAVLAVCMFLLGVVTGRFVIPFATDRIHDAQTVDAEAEQEYARAREFGFITEELLEADPDATVVTWSGFCSMLSNMISVYDETLLSEWEQMTEDAPNTPMMRDGGMVSLLFVAELMGIDEFNSPPPAEFQDYAPRVWQTVTMDYPVFDYNRYKMIDEGCVDNNYVGPSYDYSVRRVSVVTGKPLLEFDAHSDLRLEHPFTLREAVQAVLRLFESVG